MNCPKKQARNHVYKGFTIVELMGVLAILSILVMLALPAYLDYTSRAKVAEGISLAAGPRASVMDTYHTGGSYSFPESNTEAGLPAPINYRTEIVDNISVGNNPSPGTITITYRLPALGTDNQLQLIPTQQNGAILWTCTPAATNGISGNYVPASCR